MASSFILSIVLLLFTVVNTTTVTALPEHEYNALLSALRYRGYHVFANAITTTDLHYDIINGGNFTFFAPVNSVLYTLDMSMSAGDYTTTMRFHVVPHRLSHSDLLQLPYGLTSFPTLLHDHEIHIVNPQSLPLPISVEGVHISVPDMYYDAHIVVHGLESVIDFRSVHDTLNFTSIAESLTPLDVRHEAYAPSPQTFVVTGIDTVASSLPVSKTPHVPFFDGSQTQRRRQPETRSVSISQSIQLPKIKSESVTQSQFLENEAESATQSHDSPETRAEYDTRSHLSLETKSKYVTQSLKSPGIYFESTTQPLEDHVSVAAGSELLPQKINHVSLAMRSIGDDAGKFTQVDDNDMMIDCPVTDDDREQLNIANIRHGDHYMRELYTPTKMTCAHRNVW